MSFNNKGITLVESLIAVMLTGIAIIGLLTMQPMAMKSAGKADSMARATEIMQRELETIECSLMHDINTVPAVDASVTVDNETFTINTTIGPLDSALGTRLVRVRVTWPGNTNGVRSSMIVSRQSTFD